VKQKLEPHHLKNIQEAIDGLYGAFDWSASDEGGEYWQTVVHKLNGYRDGARRKVECKEEIAELKRRIAELEARC
jgi:hypothetical protein